MYLLYVLCPRRPEEGVEYPGIDVTVSELPCRSWELILGSLQDQQVLLFAEPFFQAPCSAFLVV